VRAAGSRRVWIGLAAVLTSTLVFGSTPAVVTFLRGDLSVVDVVTYRALIAAALLFLVSFVAERSREGSRTTGFAPGASRWRGVLAGAGLYAPQLMLFYLSFDRIDTGLAVALGFTYPTLVVLLVAFRARRRPPAADLALSVVAVLSVGALVLPGSEGGVDPVGVALVLVSAAWYAAYVVAADGIVASVSPLRLGAHVSTGVAVMGAAVGLTTGQLSLPDTGADWAVMVSQGVLQVVAIGTYFLGLVRLGATRTSLVDTSQPLIAVVVGSVLLGERMLAVQVAGVVMVTLSVAVSAVHAHRHPPALLGDQP
jgi:drug/metabolite transporter (DMT)-like permease